VKRDKREKREKKKRIERKERREKEETKERNHHLEVFLSVLLAFLLLFYLFHLIFLSLPSLEEEMTLHPNCVSRSQNRKTGTQKKWANCPKVCLKFCPKFLLGNVPDL
jgi:hypothetical protein